MTIVITLVPLLKLVLSIAWFVFVVCLVVKFYHPIRYLLLPRLTGFKALGMEFSFILNSIDAALNLADKNPKWKVKVPRKARQNVLNRAREHLDIFQESSLLWLDDNPENNLNEWRMFSQLDMKIELARDTKQALEILHKKKFDVVLSDMARGDKQDAGIQFLKKFRKVNKSTPVIFYIGTFNPEKGIPVGSNGITNRPDELLHLVLDALERRKY